MHLADPLTLLRSAAVFLRFARLPASLFSAATGLGGRRRRDLEALGGHGPAALLLVGAVHRQRGAGVRPLQAAVFKQARLESCQVLVSAGQLGPEQHGVRPIPGLLRVRRTLQYKHNTTKSTESVLALFNMKIQLCEKGFASFLISYSFACLSHKCKY